MRMWIGVDPPEMCRQHLLGEHNEIHMMIGSIKAGTSLRGYIKGGLLAPQLAEHRHRLLVREMVSRGYNHNSPLPTPTGIPVPVGMVDTEKSREDIAGRCRRCRNRMRAH